MLAHGFFLIGSLGILDRMSIILKKALFLWLPAFLAISFSVGISYGSVQQSIRQSAYEPQVQMAEDAVRSLQNGTSPADITGSSVMDISQSLLPFVMIYDSSGKVIASSGTLSGETPLLPPGVLSSAQVRGEDRLTWQPADNVRIAAVIVPFSSSHPGYVLAGRSMRESEMITERLLSLALASWLIAIAFSFCVMLLIARLQSDANSL